MIKIYKIVISVPYKSNLHTVAANVRQVRRSQGYHFYYYKLQQPSTA